MSLQFLRAPMYRTMALTRARPHPDTEGPRPIVGRLRSGLRLGISPAGRRSFRSPCGCAGDDEAPAPKRGCDGLVGWGAESGERVGEAAADVRGNDAGALRDRAAGLLRLPPRPPSRSARPGRRRPWSRTTRSARSSNCSGAGASGIGRLRGAAGFSVSNRTVLRRLRRSRAPEPPATQEGPLNAGSLHDELASRPGPVLVGVAGRASASARTLTCGRARAGPAVGAGRTARHQGTWRRADAGLAGQEARPHRAATSFSGVRDSYTSIPGRLPPPPPGGAAEPSRPAHSAGRTVEYRAR